MKSISQKFGRFIRKEDGLVTVEWVALTAGMVVAAIAIGYIVMNSTAANSSGIGNNISSTVSAIYGGSTASKLGG